MHDENYQIPSFEEPVRTKSTLILISYLFIFFFLGFIVSSVIIYLYLLTQGLQMSDIYFEGEIIDSIYQFVGSYTNFIVYILGTVLITILAFPDLKADWQQLKRKTIKFWPLFGMGIGVYLISNYATNLLFELIDVSGSSTNQETIIEMVNGPYFILIAITTVVFAPIVEELVFRKAMFTALKKSNKLSIIFIIIISALTFASIHFVNPVIELIVARAKYTAFFDELVHIIPYFISGLALGYIYYKSEENIFLPIAIHLVNNLVAIIAILIYPYLPI